MKIFIYIAAVAILLVMWVYYFPILVFLAAHHSWIFRYLFIAFFLLLFFSIFSIIKFLFEEENLKSKIKEKDENIRKINNELFLALDEKKEAEQKIETIEGLKIETTSQKEAIEVYREAIKKLNNNKKRMTRDISNCQNRITRMKKELKQSRETTINSSPA